MEEEYGYVVDNNGSLLVDEGLINLSDTNQNEKIYHKIHCIYLFVDKRVPGIKFYDKSLVNYNKFLIKWNGKFVTDKKSICEANWDDTINVLNKTMASRTYNGEMIINTFIVTKAEMQKVLQEIKNSINPNHIVIDIGLKNRYKFEKKHKISRFSNKKKI